MGMFKNPNDPDNQMIRDKIKEWLLQYLHIDQSSVSSIDEVPCRDPGCPDIFTRIVCIQNTEPKEFIVHKPLTFVRKVDIKALVNELI